MTRTKITLAILIPAGIYFVIHNTKTCQENCIYSERKFIPAHVNVWYENHCIMHDTKNGSCTASIPIRHEDHIPDKWYITWNGVDSHTTEVSKDLFDNPPAGQVHEHWRWKGCRRSLR